MKKQIHNKLNRDFSKDRSPDSLSVHERSRRMSLIHSKSSKFEQNFILALKKETRKTFNKNDALILGKPDIVFNEDRICVFLDSNFWHGWQYPRWKHLLKNDFWRKKIERNRARDRSVTRKLRADGWLVLRFWEHQLKVDQFTCVKKVIDSLG